MINFRITPRLRVKHALLTVLAIVVAGCVETGPESTKMEISVASPKSFINAFNRYCAPFIDAPGNAIGVLHKDGYVLAAKVGKIVNLYTRSPDQPLVGLMTDKGTTIGCNIMSRPDKTLVAAVATYMGRVSGAKPIEVGKRGVFDKTWVTEGPNDIFYVTFTAPDRRLGTLYTFSVGKAQ